MTGSTSKLRGSDASSNCFDVISVTSAPAAAIARQSWKT
jgi:hypothetical protein